MEYVKGDQLLLLQIACDPHACHHIKQMHVVTMVGRHSQPYRNLATGEVAKYSPTIIYLMFT
jgi:predicted dinucleotide-utilizing enzyme